MEMTNKKWYLYSLRAYKIQSIVILFFILVFYMYLKSADKLKMLLSLGFVIEDYKTQCTRYIFSSSVSH